MRWWAINCVLLIAQLLLSTSGGLFQCPRAEALVTGTLSSPLLCSTRLSIRRTAEVEDAVEEDDDDDEKDTVRVRIWKALASGEEMSLKKLGAAVGQHKDLQSHLTHVEKQAKTLTNKNAEWRKRRGLPDKQKIDKLRLIKRRDKKRQIYVRLG